MQPPRPRQIRPPARLIAIAADLAATTNAAASNLVAEVEGDAEADAGRAVWDGRKELDQLAAERAKERAAEEAERREWQARAWGQANSRQTVGKGAWEGAWKVRGDRQTVGVGELASERLVQDVRQVQKTGVGSVGRGIPCSTTTRGFRARDAL